MRFKLFLESLTDYLPKLTQLENNLNVISNLGNVRLYFSYETLIAYSYRDKTLVRQNELGSRTGRHINRIKGDAQQIPADAFLEEYIRDIGSKFGSNNLPTLTAYAGGRNARALNLGPQKVLYFSYQTLIAFTQNEYLIIRENQVWPGQTSKVSAGTVTGKHLNAIMKGKERRVDEEMFAGLFNDLYAADLR